MMAGSVSMASERFGRGAPVPHRLGQGGRAADEFRPRSSRGSAPWIGAAMFGSPFNRSFQYVMERRDHTGVAIFHRETQAGIAVALFSPPEDPAGLPAKCGADRQCQRESTSKSVKPL